MRSHYAYGHSQRQNGSAKWRQSKPVLNATMFIHRKWYLSIQLISFP